ncbi:uncharacterized protein [Anabrus simplex]|uniref:uncharacterized protein n=1 Tax=Anabrus simplex TaxID=316456 RepID=UPI0035A2B7D6
MVRNYKRKTEKGAGGAYSSEDLEKALSDVKNGNKTTRGAAAFYNIPRSTLKHYVLGTRGKGNVSQGPNKGGGGVKSYLSADDEEELANGIRIMEKNGFGLTREEVLDIVKCYIVQNKLETRFKNQRPGEDWFRSFRKRNRLSIKLPQSIEHSRCDQTNPWIIYDFFDKLTQVVKELGLNGKPGQIYNCDETAFCHDPYKTRVVGAINEKSQRKTSASGRENTTALLCVSADGKLMPLLCVFKGKFVMENWIDQQVPTQTAVSASERGWMETTLFFHWFRDVFLTNIGTERPVLLLYDGHSTHISTQLIRLAQKNDVTIMKLPPHTTHILHPLDVAVFRGLKQKWDKELCKWQRQNPRKKIPKADFIGLLSKTALEVSSSTIINGFRATGIYDPDPEIQGPNRKAIPESIFSPRDLEKYKKHLTICDGTKETTEAGPSTAEPKDPITVEHKQPLTSQREQLPTLEPEQRPPTESERSSASELQQLMQSDPAQTSTFQHEQPLEPEQRPTAETEWSSASELQQLMQSDPAQPSTSQHEKLLEPEQHPTAETEQPSTSELEQSSTLKRKTFEELLLDLVRNDKTSDKPKKRKKLLITVK